MYRNIGINQEKEASAIMRYRKFPALHHSTKVHTEYTCNNDNGYNKNSHSCECGSDAELCVNGHTYKMNKQKLAAVGVGALVTIGAYKAYKMFRRG
jgi:hypothetical protein